MRIAKLLSKTSLCALGLCILVSFGSSSVFAAAKSTIASPTLAPTALIEATKKPCPPKACCIFTLMASASITLFDACLGDACKNGGSPWCVAKFAFCATRFAPYISAWAISQGLVCYTTNRAYSDITYLAADCGRCLMTGLGYEPSLRAPLSTQNQGMDIDAAFEEILRADPSLMEKILKIQPCMIEKLKAVVVNGGQLSLESISNTYHACENSCYTVQNPCGGTSLPSPAPTPIY